MMTDNTEFIVFIVYRTVYRVKCFCLLIDYSRVQRNITKRDFKKLPLRIFDDYQARFQNPMEPGVNLPN